MVSDPENDGSETLGARARANRLRGAGEARASSAGRRSTVAGYAMARGDTNNLAALGWTIVGTAWARGRGVGHQPGHRARSRQSQCAGHAYGAADGRLGPVEGLAFAAIPLVLGLMVLASGFNVSQLPGRAGHARQLRRGLHAVKRRTSFATVIGAIPGRAAGDSAGPAEGTLSQGVPGCCSGPLSSGNCRTFHRHRLDVPRGLCPRRLPDAAGDRADGRSTARQAVSTPRRCCPVALAPTLVGCHGHCLLRRRPRPPLLFSGIDAFRDDRAVSGCASAVLFLDRLSALLWSLMSVDAPIRRPTVKSTGPASIARQDATVDLDLFPPMNLAVSDLPLVNASPRWPQSAGTGYVCIRQRRNRAHRAVMVAGVRYVGAVSHQLPGLPTTHAGRARSWAAERFVDLSQY